MTYYIVHETLHATCHRVASNAVKYLIFAASLFHDFDKMKISKNVYLTILITAREKNVKLIIYYLRKDYNDGQ